MSKRGSSGQANTLYNYFQSPKQKAANQSGATGSGKPNPKKPEDTDTNVIASSENSSSSVSTIELDFNKQTPPKVSVRPPPLIPAENLDSRDSDSVVAVPERIKSALDKFRFRPKSAEDLDVIETCSSSINVPRKRKVLVSSDSNDSDEQLESSVDMGHSYKKPEEDLDLIEMCTDESSPNVSKKRSRAVFTSSDSDEQLSNPNVAVALIHYPKGNPEDTKSKLSKSFQAKGKQKFATPSLAKGKQKAFKKHATKKRRILPVDSESDSSEQDSDVPGPSRKQKRKSSHETNKENILEQSSTSAGKFKSLSQAPGSGEGILPHTKLDFLLPKNIRDINKNRPDHPDYDKRTLYVPEDFLKKQTPAMHQWWVMKRLHYDTVIFFKVGKFYELYHMDATIGVNFLQLTYMKGEFAHCGFPEVAFGRYASSLVEQGYKVARIEQTETPEMMQERVKSSKQTGKLSKVVNREICQIITSATIAYGAQLPGAKEAAPTYMLAIAEKPSSNEQLRFGVCFIDTSIGEFHLGEFDDDRYYSRLLALLAENSPGMILTERGHLQQETSNALKNAAGNARRETLASITQFYTAQNTLDRLHAAVYFRDSNDAVHWPPTLYNLMNCDAPKPEFELAIRALGACLWYLKDSELDIQLFTMQKFNIYEPTDICVNKDVSGSDNMVLDSSTMHNLSLLGSTGTLQKTIDFCVTPIGHRLLKHWICRPLCLHNRVLERQNAVEELYRNDELRRSVRALFRHLPDLERQITKIHAFGNKYCASNHPDGRAIFYEAKTYSKRKITDLLETLDAFAHTQKLPAIFKECHSSLLKKLSQYPTENGILPNLSPSLEFFNQAFDHQKAETDGKIIPQPGVDKDYDTAELAINDLQLEINAYLTEQEAYFGCSLKYFGSDKKRFQIEVPERYTKKATGGYQFEGSRKGKSVVKRYTTIATRKFLADMLKAEATRNRIVQDLNRRTFEQFNKRREEWEKTIHCVTVLDAICSLAEYARTCSRTMCFPKILSLSEEPLIKIEDGVHPCTLLEDFVPNSTELGTSNHARIMILTGPNMGGKSTLMRQVALIAILAQMGCAVPAVTCEINLIDRIFTRLGASDDILRGQSTLLVELSEAAVIMKHATSHSLVLVDELGRGTSTFDGVAIATAYVRSLLGMNCRTIFSTHYHTLVDHFSNRNDIQLGHMACMAEPDDQEDNDDAITLLYQLQEGNCPKSYGFNAARISGFPKTVISRARAISRKFEERTKTRKLIRDLCALEVANAAQNMAILLNK